uniref:Uncharacterized protein n=1 Tax=Cacopsylla melanoneura TaxID=428564 RepID=A0A8D8SV17_9HEMI
MQRLTVHNANRGNQPFNFPNMNHTQHVLKKYPIFVKEKRNRSAVKKGQKRPFVDLKFGLQSFDNIYLTIINFVFLTKTPFPNFVLLFLFSQKNSSSTTCDVFVDLFLRACLSVYFGFTNGKM